MYKHFIIICGFLNLNFLHVVKWLLHVIETLLFLLNINLVSSSFIREES